MVSWDQKMTVQMSRTCVLDNKAKQLAARKNGGLSLLSNFGNWKSDPAIVVHHRLLFKFPLHPLLGNKCASILV